jgi:hypothetical protein
LTDVLEVLTASVIRAIVLMMEALNTSETLVNFYQNTRRNSPENSHLHTRHHDNLKSHMTSVFGMKVRSQTQLKGGMKTPCRKKRRRQAA